MLNLVKTKRKNDDRHQRYYWLIFTLLTCLLIANLKFPLRPFLWAGLFGSVIFYAIVSYKCVRLAKRMYNQFGKHSRSLVTVILLCAILSGWQVFDLTILRKNIFSRASGSIRVGGTPAEYEHIKDYVWWDWYSPRFPDENIMCHMIYEETFGNGLIAIAIKIDHRPWYVCGG